jgi:enhancing lycopene biosynthesis protein 2
MDKKIGVLLSGCGVFDGSEIHESVFALSAIAELGSEAICIGVNGLQHHVINHLTGEELTETRNMLVEAARIARGRIRDIETMSADELDALVIPGGFGSAKNLTSWALTGPLCEIRPSVQSFIRQCHSKRKPIAALCVSPIVVAKALQGTGVQAEMTLGTTAAPSEYDIAGFSTGLEATGARATMKHKNEIQVDLENRIVSAPCYMMETDLVTLRKNIVDAVAAVIDLCRS